MIWYTICGGLLFTNLILLFIYIGGYDGLLFTWIPIQSALVTVTFTGTALSLDQLLQVLFFNFASHLIPVCFLVVFSIGLQFSPPYWKTMWGAAIISLVLPMVGLYLLSRSAILLFIAGIITIIINVVNVAHMNVNAPETVNITWKYVGVCNILTTICIIGLSLLVEYGHTAIATILTNIPVVSIVVLAQSTLVDRDRLLTQRHIALLALQIWPSIAFTISTILCLKMEWEQTLLIPTVFSLIIVLFQFVVFRYQKRKRKQEKKTKIKETVFKYNLLHRGQNIKF